jgi:hypothetical protein
MDGSTIINSRQDLSIVIIFNGAWDPWSRGKSSDVLTGIRKSIANLC